MLVKIENVNIRAAKKEDIKNLFKYDKHITESELHLSVSAGRTIVAEKGDVFAGWLRWNMFWDSIPFMNMLYILENYRNCGVGISLVLFWEDLMKKKGHNVVMTSSLANESAQHFYRKLKYADAGSLLLKNEPMEIIFVKDLL